MNRKFKYELKEAYKIPEPSRKDEFFQNLEENQHDCAPPLRIFAVRRYAAIALAAAAFMGIYCSYKNTSDLNCNFSTDRLMTVTEGISEKQSENITLTASGTESTDETDPAVKPSVSVNIAVPTYTGASEEPDSNEVITDSATVPDEQETETSSEAYIQTQTDAAVTEIKTENTATHTATSPVQTVTSAGSAEPPNQDRDYTVTPPVQYSVTEKIREYEEHEDVNGYPSTDSEGLWWTDMADASELIVSGTVQAVFYTGINGRPWTQTDIVINEVWDGDLKPGDKISIYSPGGYMPLSEFIEQNGKDYLFSDMTQEEISQTTLHDYGGNTADPQTGENGLYFLKKGSGAITEGAYQYSFNTDICLFRQDGESFKSAAYDICSFTKDELMEYLD